jgi:AraC family ethanolamine operon transcriptional activator
VRRLRLDRFEQFAALLRQHDAVVSTLGAGDFSFEGTSVSLGRVSVVTGRNSPLLVQASVPADTVWVLFPFRGSQLRLNGCEWRPGLITVHGAGATHLGVNHGPAAWAAVLSRSEEIEQLLPRMPAGTGRGGATATLLTDPDAWERARVLFQAIDEVAGSDPDVFGVNEAQRSLRAQVMETLFEVIQGASGSSRARLVRPSRGRERVIRAIDDRCRANPAQVVTAADLARDLAISEPRVRSAVRATFGIGLSRYLLIRRLLALHAAASDRSADLATRRTLATAHGFWNLGALEREYRLLFNEHFFGQARG